MNNKIQTNLFSSEAIVFEIGKVTLQPKGTNDRSVSALKIGFLILGNS